MQFMGDLGIHDYEFRPSRKMAMSRKIRAATGEMIRVWSDEEVDKQCGNEICAITNCFVTLLCRWRYQVPGGDKRDTLRTLWNAVIVDKCAAACSSCAIDNPPENTGACPLTRDVGGRRSCAHAVHLTDEIRREGLHFPKDLPTLLKKAMDTECGLVKTWMIAALASFASALDSFIATSGWPALPEGPVEMGRKRARRLDEMLTHHVGLRVVKDKKAASPQSYCRVTGELKEETAANLSHKVMADYLWTMAHKFNGRRRFCISVDASTKSKKDTLTVAMRGLLYGVKPVAAWAPIQVLLLLKAQAVTRSLFGFVARCPQVCVDKCLWVCGLLQVLATCGVNPKKRTSHRVHEIWGCTQLGLHGIWGCTKFCVGCTIFCIAFLAKM